MRSILAILVVASASAAQAESLVATRTLPARTLVVPEDVTVVDAEIPGALSVAADAVGLELRVTVYAGRPLRAQDLQPVTLVDRNQIVALVFLSRGLSIRAEGRALERGAEGDWIRAINLASRSTVSGRVTRDGSILVGDPD